LGEGGEAHNRIILVGPARYTHAMPDYLDRAREQFDRYLADEVQLAEATG
jgi:hypothetical protein